MIKGTTKQVQAVATLVDKASRLPLASPDYPCPGPLRCVDCGTVAEYGATVCDVEECGGKLKRDGCGYHLITVEDYEAETVRCPACGTVTPAGDRAATIQVRRVRTVEGVAEYDSSEELEAEVAAAKLKPSLTQSVEEKALAAVEVVEAKPATDTKIEPKEVVSG